jgi:hypothetical protein
MPAIMSLHEFETPRQERYSVSQPVLDLRPDEFHKCICQVRGGYIYLSFDGGSSIRAELITQLLFARSLRGRYLSVRITSGASVTKGLGIT